MTQHPDIFAALLAPFDSDEVKQRSQGGKQLTYVTARTVMNRLDDVLGPENWWDRYTPREHSCTCELTIRLPDGRELTKADCGGNAGMSDEGDDDKSGFSDAFKRAAVKFGVGRYLHRDGIPRFARDHLAGRPGRQAGEDPVEPEHREPAPLQPAGNGHVKTRQDWGTAGHGEEARRSGGANGGSAPPKSGGALYAWLKEQDEKHDYGLVKFVNGWGKREDMPERMVTWNTKAVEAAYKLACNRIIDLRRSQHLQDEMAN